MYTHGHDSKKFHAPSLLNVFGLNLTILVGLLVKHATTLIVGGHWV